MSKLRVDQLSPNDDSVTINIKDLMEDTFTPSDGVERKITDALLDLNNVKNYGATGDGSTDDTSSIQKAIDDIDNEGVIYFPAGTYIVSSTISWQGKSISIVGSGKQCTFIKTNISDIIFNAGNTSPVGSFFCRDISLRTTVVNVTTGFDITFDGSASQALGYRRPMCDFRDITFQGDGIYDGSFKQCIKTTDALLPKFQDIHMIFYPAVDGTQTGKGILCTTKNGGVAVYRFERVYSLFGNKVIQIDSESSPGIEGVYINDCDFVYCVLGIEAINSATDGYLPPQFFVSNTHCEAFKNALALSLYNQPNIRDCLFYKMNQSTTSDPVIYLNGCTQGLIHDMIVVTRPNNTAAAGIVLNACKNMYVHDIHGATQSGQPVVSLTNSVSGSNNKVRDIKQTNSGTTVVDSNPLYNQSTSLIASTGFQWSGDLLRQWGVLAGTTDSSGNLSVTFPRAFNTLYNVIAVNTNESAGNEAVTILNKSATGFTAHFEGAATAAREVSWQSAGV